MPHDALEEFGGGSPLLFDCGGYRNLEALSG
jgi:hypothetical protein